MPTDSGAFRSQFCGREIVAVLIVGGVPFEKAGATVRADSARARHGPASALQTIENLVRLSEGIGEFMN